MVIDPAGSLETASAPAPAPGPKPLSQAEKERAFGAFRYRPVPMKGDPEHISITDDWAQKNIVSVYIDQLHGLVGAPESCRIPWHRAATSQLLDLWAEWDRLGLLPHVQSWGGSWCPRFVRGSRTQLSSHAWGTAFDINAPWNPMGRQPAPPGAKGSVLELVPVARKWGFAWGGDFSRCDPMHFEVAEVLR